MDDVLRGSPKTVLEIAGRGNGAANYTLPGSVTANLGAGTHPIKVIFDGDGDYLAAQSTSALAILPDCVVMAVVPSQNGYHLDNFGLEVPVRIPVLNLDIPFLGRCYGISARSIDYFKSAVPIRNNNVRTSGQENDLNIRQLEVAVELPYIGAQLVRGIVGGDTMAEDYAWLRQKLAQGEAWPIFLSGPLAKYSGPADLIPPLHVVVAYKACDNYLGQTGKNAIFVYDPNVNARAPGADDMLRSTNQRRRNLRLDQQN